MTSLQSPKEARLNTLPNEIHNADLLVGIHRLPFELLGLTFQQVLQIQCSSFHTSFPIPSYYSWLWILRLVCHHWKKVVDASPSLWAYISPMNPPVVLQMALRMSGTYPLTVDWTGDPFGMPRDMVDVQFAVLGQFHRLRALRIDTSCQRDFWHMVLGARAPPLEELDVDGLEFVLPEHQTTLLDNTPLLTRVTITRLPPSNDPPAFKFPKLSNLQTLTLSMQTRRNNRPAMPFPQFREIISQSPDLVSLSLLSMRIGAPESDKVTPVKLNSLNSLEIRFHGHPKIYGHILGHIIAPGCHTTILRFPVDQELADSSIRAITVYLLNASGLNREDGSGNLELRCMESTIRLGSATVLCAGHWSTLVPGLISYLPPSIHGRITSVVLDQDAIGQAADLISVSFPAVVDVTVHISNQDSNVLMQSQFSKPTNIGWLFPRMQTFRISAEWMSSGVLKDVLAMGKARQTYTTSLDQIHVKGAPHLAEADWLEGLAQLRAVAKDVIHG